MMTIKNVMVAGASGTIGSPIVSALLASSRFHVSALSRPESTATFPGGVTVKTADPTSRPDLVKALRGQDALIVTLNDAAAHLQAELVEAAYEAGVKRYMPNEWASHGMVVEGTPMEEAFEGKKAIVELLNQKVKLAEVEGKEFSWTGLNTGVFFDWALYASFLDISLPPTATAKIWNSGDATFSVTNLSTVGKAVVATLTTAEGDTRNKQIEIESFSTSQNEIVAALEQLTGQKWETENATTEEQLKIAAGFLEKGDFLEAFYIWVRVWVFSGKEGAKLTRAEEGNKLLGVGGEQLMEVAGKVLKGEKV